MFKVTIKLPDEAFQPLKDLLNANMLSLNEQLLVLKEALAEPALQEERKKNIEEYVKVLMIQGQIVHDILAGMPDKHEKKLIHTLSTTDEERKLIV